MKFPTNMTTEKLLSGFLRAAFIGCVIALAILAWMPAKAMTRTILGGHVEHFIAYLGTAVLMACRIGSVHTRRAVHPIDHVCSVSGGGTGLFARSSPVL
jgi:hypothetical protein